MDQKINKIIIAAGSIILIFFAVFIAQKSSLKAVPPALQNIQAVNQGSSALASGRSATAVHGTSSLPIAFNDSATWSLPRQAMTLVVASTSAEQELGLGNRASLASTSGMLFVFDTPGNYGFWMKNMEFPIDIIWLDQNYKIIHIEHSLSPSTYPSVFLPGSPAKYVIEVNAGFSDANSLSVGQTLQIF